MKKLYGLKRTISCAAATVFTIGIAGSSMNYTPASANSDSEYFYEGSDQTAVIDSTADSEISSQEEQSQQQTQTDSSSSDSNSSDSNSSSSGFDITEYATKLRNIAEQQAKLDEEISKAESSIQTEEEKQKNLKKKIESVNEEIDVLNSYMTALEIKISTNKREIAEKKQEIEDGIESFKQRLRAMYIAGSDSYTTMILESDSFYDVLMRMELIKRVASHDNDMIDNLINLKNQYESKQVELEAQQEEYNKQNEQLTKQKKKLDELYNSSEETKKELIRKKKALEAQNKAYDSEKSQFESSLSGILKSSSGTTSRDEQVTATMALADQKLEELHKEIAERKKEGEKLGKYEATYEFAWPVPDHYNVSSGVGARWGAYHSGIDITGAHGTEICASDSGTVLRINTTCTHDYGKTKSCGCGGGYGNYIIIDHGNEFITLYGHLTEVDVQVGDQVKKGEVIGKMGSTGFSTGDHLHFEIRYQGYIVNPAYYVNVT